MTSETPRWLDFARWAGGLIAIVVGAILASGAFSPAAGWFATALVLLGGWGIYPAFVELGDRVSVPARWRLAALVAAPYALVALVVGWATWPAVVGGVPFTQDHAHHYLQTFIFTDDLVANGHLFGWTEKVGGGIPFGDVYATGVYAVTGFLRIVSFGFVSKATSYAFGVYLVWLIPAWAIVAWTRRLVAHYSDSKAALVLGPAFGAAAFALDIGADREGGWVYSMFHAVWPQVVGTGMWLWAVLVMVRLVERPTFRRLGVAVIVTGFAFWAHPMNALNLLITAPILFLCVIALRPTEEAEIDPRATAWWLVPAFGLAGIIGFAWISHMLAASDVMLSITAYGQLLETSTERWLEAGAFFENGFALVGIAALAGFVVALRGRALEQLFTVVGFVVFALLASNDLFASSEFGLSESAPFIMFKRFVVTAKPLFYALSGLGVAVVAVGASKLRAADEARTPWATALLILAVSPFVWAGFDALPDVVRTNESRVITAEDAGLSGPLGEILALIDREQDATPGPKRVVVWFERGHTGDYALFALAEGDLGHLSNRNPPCHGFTEINIPRDIDHANFLGASHIITRSDRDFPQAKKLGEFGIYRLWRINNKPGTGVRILEGNAFVRTLSWSPMRHEVKVENSREGDSLIFGLPPYHQWNFTQNGKTLETADYRQGTMTFTQVKGIGDGVVVAEFDDTTTERVAFALMLVVLLLAIVALFFDRALPLLPQRWARRAVPAVCAVSLGIVMVGVLWARSEGIDALEQKWSPGEDDRVLATLHRQEPFVDFRPRPFCLRPMSRRPRVECDASQMEPRLRLGAARGTSIPVCMELTVPDGGFLEATFELPPGTTRVVGFAEGDTTSIRFSARVDNELKKQTRRIDVSVDGDESLTLRLENGGRRVRNPCLELVAIGR